MRILGVSGSLRPGSFNTMLIDAAAAISPDGVEFSKLECLHRIPPFDQSAEDDPPAEVELLRAAFAEADAVLIATPEYNCSIPGTLKNALDWLSRPLEGCPVRYKNAAVIGASTSSFGAVWAQAELRKVLKAMGARVLETEFAVPGCNQHFDQDGRIASLGLQNQLGELLADLCAETRRDMPLSASSV